MLEDAFRDEMGMMRSAGGALSVSTSLLKKVAVRVQLKGPVNLSSWRRVSRFGPHSEVSEGRIRGWQVTWFWSLEELGYGTWAYR